jgi:HEAT repeat protein
MLKSLLTSLFLVVLLQLGSARADRLDNLATILQTSPGLKVRISAALSLLSLGDQRALEPLVAALQDRDKSVRAVSASALGKLVDGRTDARTRVLVLKKLKHASLGDTSAFVRRQALQSYEAIAKTRLRK